jgi:hypothetical protein
MTRADCQVLQQALVGHSHLVQLLVAALPLLEQQSAPDRLLTFLTASCGTAAGEQEEQELQQQAEAAVPDLRARLLQLVAASVQQQQQKQQKQQEQQKQKQQKQKQQQKQQEQQEQQKQCSPTEADRPYDSFMRSAVAVLRLISAFCREPLTCSELLQTGLQALPQLLPLPTALTCHGMWLEVLERWALCC